ncbi:unnamed protein product [Caenorhabditis brenneri]
MPRREETEDEEVERKLKKAFEIKRKDIAGILRLYKEIDYRLSRLGSHSPYPHGYHKVSEEELNTKCFRELKRINDECMDILTEIFDTEMNLGALCACYCDCVQYRDWIGEWWEEFRRTSYDFIWRTVFCIR